MSETQQPKMKNIYSNGEDWLDFGSTFSLIREGGDKVFKKTLGKYANKWTKGLSISATAALFYQAYEMGLNVSQVAADKATRAAGGILAVAGLVGMAAMGTAALAYANSDKMKERLNYAKKNTIGRAADLVKRFGETRKELSQPEWTVEGDRKVAHHEPGKKPSFWQVVQKMRGEKGSK